MREVISFFGAEPPECVFCGSNDLARWDHLVSIKKGGETVIGNMVPACSRCDDSKRDLQYEEWMMSDANLSPKTRGVKNLKRRIARVRRYVSRFGYRPRPLGDRLSKTQARQLDDIRLTLSKVRKDIDDLIDQHRGAKTRAHPR